MQVSHFSINTIIQLKRHSSSSFRAFTRAITVRCMAAQRTQPNYHVNYQEALKIADRTAQQYQIFLGSETLPRLLLRNLSSGSRIRVNHLSRYMCTKDESLLICMVVVHELKSLKPVVVLL